ncbi:MAG: indolepyruvate ferredoxin oxidoreductase subunit alpha [Oscillospiraceae bacterium]|nr:indolepyruvate ferredoxin oxidoreductase subunit alpha [Oscillospiraceae bacterium]
MEKKLLLGNEAVARGLYEAGVKVVSAYPGTPSTEITESVVQYPEIFSEWAPNEKVAFEVAFGACTGGVRSFCAMKHVGLNVAADPLYTASYIGVNAGMVCAVADDPGMHSSQNEQDSRNHAIASKVPMLEPCDSAECKSYAKLAFDISEEFDTPVLLRLSTRISHSRSAVEIGEREERPDKEYVRDVMKNIMMPAQARVAHEKVEKRTEALREYAEVSGINSIEYNDKKIGIIAAGSAYAYAREALGESASYLKLGMVNPLPIKLIKEFAENVEKLYVIEELDDIIETHCRKHGVDVTGKEIFSRMGEFSQRTVREALLGEVLPTLSVEDSIPPRPPVLCAGCPHRGLFYALKKNNLFVSGDIGCYTLGAQAPLSMIDTVVCMGASVSGLHGFNTARGKEQAKKAVAVIGDSTFIHSGITGLIDLVYNKGMSTVIVLDNSITGMTGHQNNPANGLTISGDPTTAVDLEALARAIGINRVVVVDPYKVDETREAVEAELAAEEPSLVIARRPCALLKNVKHKPALEVKKDKCVGCRACLNVGCPALSQVNDEATGRTKAVIDPDQCLGCGVCTYACKFDAISEVGGDE